jgi:prepilin-type N-terminal cleavage/methylation domain-containing protein
LSDAPVIAGRIERFHIPMNRKSLIPCRQRGLRCHTRQNGFTLMELLIVISIILILMLVAIPTAGKIRKHANELSA